MMKILTDRFFESEWLWRGVKNVGNSSSPRSFIAHTLVIIYPLLGCLREQIGVGYDGSENGCVRMEMAAAFYGFPRPWNP